MDRREITEQLTVCLPEDDLTIEFDRPEVLVQKLPPGLQRRQDIEWIGVMRRSKGGELGGFGRLKATGGLVEVFDRWLSIARPGIAAALSAALDEELRRLLHEPPDDSQADEHSDQT